MDKLIEAARKRDEAYDLWIITFEVVKSEVGRIGVSPGDRIAGLVTRQVLRTLRPDLLRYLDKLGMGPGR